MAGDPQRLSIPEALQLGIQHHLGGRLAEAERIYRGVLAVDAANANAHHLLGLIALRAGRPELAAGLIGQAVRSLPGNAHFQNDLGEAYRALRQPDDALACYDRAIAIAPGHADAWSNRSIALVMLGRPAEALASCDKALALRPDYVEAASNRGNLLQELGRYDEAVASYARALEWRPDYAEAHANCGNALQELRKYEEALASYDRAIALQPGYAMAWSSRGNALQELGRPAEALASYDRAIALQPDLGEAHFGRGVCHLLADEFERGWPEFEWRWKCGRLAGTARHFAQPAWDGTQDLAGRTLLLHAEQGLGDTIMFARYAQLAAQRGARVILEVQPALKALLARAPGASEVIGKGEPLPVFDLHCPLLSAPFAFRTRRESIPAATPYLPVDKASVSAWRRKLARRDTRLVGLCWRGDPTNARDRERRMRLADLQPLLDCRGVRFVSLQKELEDDERPIADAAHDFVHPGADFKATGELVGALDLVISIDTSWAHWAGAIGKPAWVLLARLPHWYWQRDKAVSDWYPSARLFRRGPSAGWAEVVEGVKRELLLSPRPASPPRGTKPR